MRKIFGFFIATSLLTLSIPTDVNAKQQHKIGFVKIPVSELKRTGTCGYRPKGSNNEKNLILVTGMTNNSGAEYEPLMNIDDENIPLSLINSKQEKRKGKTFNINEYKSSAFQIKTVFANTSTAKDRKNYGSRDGGNIIVTSDDGWQKTVSVECVYKGSR
jgi:hypothetical protein